MSVEKSVVINFLNKDYEIQSWNEQGEIIQVEGMLTTAFLVVSPCSHKDYWKQLYCIIKIHYLVNMPVVKDKEYEMIYREWVDELPKLKQRIKELESENKALEQRIGIIETENKLIKEEINPIKTENQILKEQLGIVDSEWKFIRDLAKRVNPVIKKSDSGRIFL